MNSKYAKDLSIIVLVIAVVILIPVIYGAMNALPSTPASTVATSTSIIATSTTPTSTGPTTGTPPTTKPVSSVPYIQYVTPTSGQIGSTVTLLGSGFASQGNAILFGDIEINNVTSSQNGTFISFVVPSVGAPNCGQGMMCSQSVREVTPGIYDISVQTANGTSNVFAFNVTPAPASQPALSSLSPASGPVGIPVTITGTGFLSSNTVLFSGGPVTNTTVSNNGTSLTFTVPSSVGADCQAGQACPMYERLISNGPNTVSVRNIDGTSNSLTYTVTGGTMVVPN